MPLLNAIGVRPVPDDSPFPPTLPALPAANGLEYAFRNRTLDPRANDFPNLCAAGDIAANRAAGVSMPGVFARFAFLRSAGVPPRDAADKARFFRFISLNIFSCSLSRFVGAGMLNTGPVLGVWATVSVASNRNGVPSIKPHVITGSWSTPGAGTDDVIVARTSA